MSEAPTFSLRGQRALITGAARGIGAGVAEAFAAAGADVVVNALTPTYLAPFVEDLAARSAGRIIGVAGDCATAAGAEALARAVAAQAGDIDILVNAVGDSIRSPFAQDPGQPAVAAATDDDIATVIQLNLMSAIHMSRRIAPQMLARGRGKVINITASTGVTHLGQLSVYAAAKAALDALTRALALEWAAAGIQVNAIAPGMFPLGEADPAYARRVPMGRFGQTWELGQLALYLASPASDYMTGQVIALDGGLGL